MILFSSVKFVLPSLASIFRRIVPCVTLACAAPAAASEPPGESGEAAPTRAEVSEKRDDLMELRGQIEALRKEMAAAESRRADTVDQVKDAEREISTTQRELRVLSARKNKTQATLKELGQQAQTLNKRLAELHARLEDQIHRQYLRSQPDTLRLLLNGEDPNQMARDLYYLGAVGRARARLLDETKTLLKSRQALSKDMRERAGELSAIETRQKEQHARLVARREQRKDVLARISSKISQQRKEIGNLQRDEKALAQLIARLNRILAAQARAAKATAPRTQPPRENDPEKLNEHTPDALPPGNFAARKGRLRLPVRGTITNRYGGVRQEGTTWKGLFIRAAQGSEIKAIAGGQVVFADWMRGFGNLLIVDHGDGYLSIYGYSDAVLKQVGDSVRGGDSIATVGNSGGNPESGLYFELRHQGRPVDPLKWVSLK